MPERLGLLEGVVTGNPTLDIGLGLLAASGPSTTPRSFGQVLASGVQFANQRANERLFNQIEREELKAMARRRQQQSAFQGFIDQQFSPAPGQGQGFGVLSPEATQQRQQSTGMLSALSPQQRQYLQALAQTDPGAAMQTIGGLLFSENGLSQEIASIEQELGRPLTEAERLELAGIEPRQTSFAENVTFLENKLGRPLTEQEIFDMAPGATRINVGDNQLDTPIPIPQISDVRLPNGQSVPLGTTYRQAQEAGAVVLSSEEQKLTQQAEAAKAVIGQLEGLAVGDTGIFTNVDSGFLNRAGAAIDFAFDILTQDDPRASRFRDLSQGTVGPLIRTLGEKGALAEGDVNRALGLLPRVFPLPDTGRVATDKLRDLRNIINKGLKNLNKQEATPGNATQSGNQGNAIDLGNGATLEIIDG